MAFDLTDPIFNNEDAARAYFELIRMAGWEACLSPLRRNRSGNPR